MLVGEINSILDIKV